MYAHQLAAKPADVKLPLAFILTGLIALILSQLLLLTHGSLLLDEMYRSPIIWTSAHLFVIGWASMVAKGAMYQLVPVAFQVSIYSKRLGYLHFGCMVAGLFGFSIGFLTFSRLVSIFSGLVLVMGFFFFIGNMVYAFKQIKKWNMMAINVLSALISLTLTILIGFILIWQLTQGGLAFQYHLPLLYTHITLGIGAWFSLLIIGFSYKLVPMFTLSHGYSMRMSVPIFILSVGGLTLFILSYFTQAQVLFFCGALVFSPAFILFGLHIYQIWQRRMRRRSDLGVKYAFVAIAFGVLCTLLLTVQSGHYLYQNELSSSSFLFGLVYLYLMGWVTLSIMGYLFKIVPFLWWTQKYSDKAGTAQVPTLKEMIDERLGRYIFPAFILGIVLVTTSIWVKSTALFYISQSMVVLLCLPYSWLIFSVLKK